MSTETTASAAQPAANTTPVIGVIDATQGFDTDPAAAAAAAGTGEDDKNKDTTAGASTDAAAEDAGDGTDDDVELGGIFERVDGVDVLSEAGRTYLKEMAANPALAEAAMTAMAERFGKEISEKRTRSRHWERKARALAGKAPAGTGATTDAAATTDTTGSEELAAVRRELAQTKAAATAGLPIELAGSVTGETPEEMLAAATSVAEKLSNIFGVPGTTATPRKRATLDASKRESDRPTVTGVDRLFG